MNSAVRIRIEVAFKGGQMLGALVSESELADFEQRLRHGDEGVVELAADDGTYLVSVSDVVYVKRFSRETRVGFGSASS